MANHLYGGYGSAYGGGSSYSSRLSGDPYLSSASRYSSGGLFGPTAEVTKYSSASLDRGSSLYSSRGELGGGIGSHSSWSGLEVTGMLSGTKRSAEALYHQNVLGSHNTIGQNDALLSSNSMLKHPRLETTSNLPVFPQRPGEKDCAHYMLTRTCKFGEACKFDHPIWVPEGGIPDWKEVPVVATESFPERPGEPDCPYFMKTQRCNFGFRCKFNHPKDRVNTLILGGDGMGTGNVDISLPERPSEPICAFYSKTGKCKFGANCKFHHPKDLQIPASAQNTGAVEQLESLGGKAVGDLVQAKTFVPVTPALLHNSKGLPIRVGEADCPFYLKTGSCKYGATCRYNHPDRTSINPPLVGQTVMPSAINSLPLGLINHAASLIPGLDPILAQASLGVGATVYPQRPGALECDFYMKTGQCKFGERCKFHHPIGRSEPRASAAQVPPNVKLTLAGLPRREGSPACAFYMKTGTCKFGVSCRFDHPPPGEAIAMATTAQGTGAAAESDGDDAAGSA